MASKSTAAGGATSLKHPLHIDMHQLPPHSSIIYNKIQPNQLKLGAKPTSNHTVQPSWVTCKCKEKVSGLGIFQWSYVVEHIGLPDQKKCYLGCIPEHFDLWSERIYNGGGWCFGSDGIFRGDVEGAKNGKLDTGITFTTGDRVTIRLDTDKQYIQIFVGSKKTSSTLKMIDFDHEEGVYPAFSFFNYSSAIKCESVSDVSVLSMLARELQAAPWDRKTWERLHGRMLETEKIQMNENGKKVELTKEDVKYRMIVWGDVETWHKELGGMLTDEKLEGKVRAAARSGQNNFLNSMFVLFDQQKNDFMTQIEEQTKVITSLIARMDKQDHEHEKKLKVLEEMVVSANEQAAQAESVALDALKQVKAANPFGERSDSHEPTPDNKLHVATTGRRKSSGGAGLFPNPKNHQESSNDLHKAGSVRTPVKPGVAGVANAQGSAAKLNSERKKSAQPIVVKKPVRKSGAPGRITKKGAGELQKPKTKRAAPGMRTIDMSAAGNTQVMQGVRRIFMLDAEVKALGEMGSPSDEDLKKCEEVKKDLGLKKLEVAKLLLNGSPSAKTEDSKIEITDLVETLVNGGDHIPGNPQLVSAMIYQIPTIDWAKVLHDRNLAPISAFDGSLKFLEMMLGVPNIKVDTVELIEACFFNQTCRIPSALVLLKHAHALDLDEFEDDISDVWQDFFEDIAAESRAIPKENRTGRVELLTMMLDHTTFKMDFTSEGPDCQTCFSRACKEGDLELAHLILERKLAEANRVSTDTTNALIQAVVGNQTSTVEYLCTAVPDIDVDHVSDNGSALHLAVALHRAAEIVALLEGKKAKNVAGKD